MHRMRLVVVVVLAVGLSLLLAAPGMAQGPKGGALMSQDVYTPIAQGYDLIRAGKYEAAAVQFKKATKIDMNNSFALNNLAAIEAQKGELKTAMALLEQATKYCSRYLDQVVDVCFVGGLCNAIKPTRKLGKESSICKTVNDNISKLKAKMAAKPAKPEPSTPPLMEKKQTPKDKGK